MAELKDWNVLAANNSSAPPNGFPEGMFPSEVNNASREVMAVIARWNKDTDGTLLTTGSANAYVLAPNRTITALTAGLRFTFNASFTNTGAATLNVSTLGAVAIERPDGSALSASSIIAGGRYSVIYDGVQFQLESAPLVVGQDVQAYDAGLTSIAALTTLADRMIYTTASDVYAVATLTAAGRDLIDDATVADQRTTLGLGSFAVLNSLALTDISDVTLTAPATGAVLYKSAGGWIDTTALTIDPAGALTGYHAGVQIFNTHSNGLEIRGSTAPGIGGGQTPYLRLEDSAGLDLGFLGFNVGADLFIASRNHGGRLSFQAENTGGTNRQVIVGDPDGALTGYYAGAAKFASTNTGFDITGSLVVSDAVTTRTNLGLGSFAVLNSLALTGLSDVTLTAPATGSVLYKSAGDWIDTTALTIDPAGALTFQHASAQVANTHTAGLETRGSINTALGGTQNSLFSMETSTGVPLAHMGFPNSSIFVIRTLNHGGLLRMEAEDTAGVLRIGLMIDPDGALTGYYAGTASLRTSLYTAADKGTGAEVLDGAGAFQPVGFNVMPRTTKDAAYTLALADVGKTIYHSNATAYAYTCANDSTIPVDATWTVMNYGTGDITLTQGAGVTITWFQGGARPTGNRTLAGTGSVCTVWKQSDTQFFVWGNGLS